MAKIILASSLMRFTNNQKKFDYEGGTLHDVLALLCKKNMELSKFIYKSPDELHPFINIFLDDKNVKDLQGLDTEINSNSIVRILPGVSGG